MKACLLDTSVLSLLAPGRTGLSATLTDWVRASGDRLYISTITVVEIEQGIAKLRRAGSDQRATVLTAWLNELIATGNERIITLDIDAAIAAGQLSDAAIAKGRHPGFADVAIAAIASSRDMLLLTTNGRHFEPLGIDFADPTMPEFLAA